MLSQFIALLLTFPVSTLVMGTADINTGCQRIALHVLVLHMGQVVQNLN